MKFCSLPVLFCCVILIFVTCLLAIYCTLENASIPRTALPMIREGHLLCVLVPYRNRWEELQQMVPHLHNFLSVQHVAHRFVVLNQTDNFRFNRASLINVGWYESDRLGCDYMVMHDVDILPLNPKLNYEYPEKSRVKHISSGKYHPILRYDYKKFIGGVLMLTLEDFKMVNGMSNKYWGWGLEDDEFFLRLKEANLTANILRPTNLTTDRSNTFRHIHAKERKRDYTLLYNQKQDETNEMTHPRDTWEGSTSPLFKSRCRLREHKIWSIFFFYGTT